MPRTAYQSAASASNRAGEAEWRLVRAGARSRPSPHRADYSTRQMRRRQKAKIGWKRALGEIEARTEKVCCPGSHRAAPLAAAVARPNASATPGLGSVHSSPSGSGAAGNRSREAPGTNGNGLTSHGTTWFSGTTDSACAGARVRVPDRLVRKGSNIKVAGGPVRAFDGRRAVRTIGRDQRDRITSSDPVALPSQPSQVCFGFRARVEVRTLF